MGRHWTAWRDKPSYVLQDFNALVMSKNFTLTNDLHYLSKVWISNVICFARDCRWRQVLIVVCSCQWRATVQKFGLWKKCILLFSRDTLNWSEVTVKMLQKISIWNNVILFLISIHQKIQKKNIWIANQIMWHWRLEKWSQE